MAKWIRTTFSLDAEVIHVLNKVPRNEIPNKSKFVEALVRLWLEKYGYEISGSIGD